MQAVSKVKSFRKLRKYIREKINKFFSKLEKDEDFLAFIEPEEPEEVEESVSEEINIDEYIESDVDVDVLGYEIPVYIIKGEMKYGDATGFNYEKWLKYRESSSALYAGSVPRGNTHPEGVGKPSNKEEWLVMVIQTTLKWLKDASRVDENIEFDPFEIEKNIREIFYRVNKDSKIKEVLEHPTMDDIWNRYGVDYINVSKKEQDNIMGIRYRIEATEYFVTLFNKFSFSNVIENEDLFEQFQELCELDTNGIIKPIFDTKSSLNKILFVEKSTDLEKTKIVLELLEKSYMFLQKQLLVAEKNAGVDVLNLTDEEISNINKSVIATSVEVLGEKKKGDGMESRFSKQIKIRDNNIKMHDLEVRKLELERKKADGKLRLLGRAELASVERKIEKLKEKNAKLEEDTSSIESESDESIKKADKLTKDRKGRFEKFMLWMFIALNGIRAVIEDYKGGGMSKAITDKLDAFFGIFNNDKGFLRNMWRMFRNPEDTFKSGTSTGEGNNEGTGNIGKADINTGLWGENDGLIYDSDTNHWVDPETGQQFYIPERPKPEKEPVLSENIQINETVPVESITYVEKHQRLDVQYEINDDDKYHFNNIVRNWEMLISDKNNYKEKKTEDSVFDVESSSSELMSEEMNIHPDVSFDDHVFGKT